MWNVADIFLMKTVIRMHFMNNQKYVFWKFQIKAIFHLSVWSRPKKQKSPSAHQKRIENWYAHYSWDILNMYDHLVSPSSPFAQEQCMQFDSIISYKR